MTDRRCQVLLIVLLLTQSVLALAQPLPFMKSSPYASFKGKDYELMSANFKAVLESDETHVRREWSNSKTGSSGFAEVLSQFVATDGAPCKRMHLVNRAGGREGEATYAVCKYPERGWLLHPDAEPAKKPATPEPESKEEQQQEIPARAAGIGLKVDLYALAAHPILIARIKNQEVFR
jgi:hypothetical protein